MIGALMWTNVFAPDTGWLALAQQQFGSGMPFGFLLNWTNDPNLLFGVLLISGVWYGFPFMMLAATAGLRMLPMECYDSALIDGASGFQLLKFVTWPLIYPLIIPAIIIRGIFAFNQFYLFQSFQIPTITLATLSYNFFNPTGFFNNGQFCRFGGHQRDYDSHSYGFCGFVQSLEPCQQGSGLCVNSHGSVKFSARCFCFS